MLQRKKLTTAFSALKNENVMNIFQHTSSAVSSERRQIIDAYYTDEKKRVHDLMSELEFLQAHKVEIEHIATDLVNTVRNEKSDQSSVDALMAEYDLSSDEGIVLMCLAEALLRIPDKETEELLIRDKLTAADWEKHAGASESLFVNLTTRGLSMSGKVLQDQSQSNVFQKLWYGLLSRCGEPVIRQAVRRSMKIMSEHFVLGRTINEALKNAKPFAEKGYLFSFDMLGEMAKTQAQADHYFEAYQHAIKIMGASKEKLTDFSSPSISIKLSALHPRYEFSQKEMVVPFLIDRLKTLALQAKEVGVYVTVDAEETTRLDMSLDIFEAVFLDSAFHDWNGLGLAVQAYQKRGYFVLQYLIALARSQRKKIPARLVKGAYSVAAILWMTRGKQASFEFQNLQGMGKPLHNVLVDPEKYAAKSRIYAPVGRHADLLPYLVRRLLENGANTSFVHQIANPEIPVATLTRNPIDQLKSYPEISNTKIPLPSHIYPDRKNSAGLDISDCNALQSLMQKINAFSKTEWVATPLHQPIDLSQAVAIKNPNDRNDIVGYVQMADEATMSLALSQAKAAEFSWSERSIDERASILEKAADLIEEARTELFALLIREAGKFLPDAVSEVREAADFCRYYALIARKILSDEKLVGH